MSIVPPFTWEAIMDPGHVDQLIHALGLAREESNRRVSVGGRKASSDSNGIVERSRGKLLRKERRLLEARTREP
jgi:hypothetical protein